MSIASGLANVGASIATAAGNIFGQKRQEKANMRLAKYQQQAYERYNNQMLEYNSPKNQMARFQEAGLNPNLIYGQGNAGNQSSPVPVADQKPANYQTNIVGEALQAFNQTRMMQSQIQAIDANTIKSQNQASLAALQAQVLAKNPLLDPAGYNAIIEGLKATAESKSSEAAIGSQRKRFLLRKETRTDDKGGYANMETGMIKMEAELRLLEQKYDLGSADQKIKSEILNSKQFQNAILEVQKRFMTDADITPQHIVQFIQLLLMKML